MANRQPIQVDEWYHCYNRGVDKRIVFMEERDYERLLLLMFLGKRSGSIQLFNERHTSLREIFAAPHKEYSHTIVEIGAYALMPNHYHFVLKEITEGGIALFMQKIFTGYTHYFNKKYDRTGALFAGTFKSKHVASDQYLRHLISYVHLNPADLIEPKWKESGNGIAKIEKGLGKYPFSSLPDFIGRERPHKALLGRDIFGVYGVEPSIRSMIREAKQYGVEKD